MVLLKSAASLLGMSCPDFHLESVDGKNYSRDEFRDAKALLITFICNHCPYVKAIEDRLLALAREFENRSIQVVAICSNNADAYPEDSKEKLLDRWQQKNYTFPYLVDEKQDVARAFSALCTPEFYLFDQKRVLYYHGRLDDSWDDESQVSQRELAHAIEQLLDGKEAPQKQHPSMGCSIKWKE
ncbi:MAG: thioredoxin family protein [Myxococcales bacterium]|nr:thioredoxin family protein [Myxococcales bacterium]USN50205.1 MAG: thioredoxin family protein [Myxococcales bacterium]